MVAAVLAPMRHKPMTDDSLSKIETETVGVAHLNPMSEAGVVTVLLCSRSLGHVQSLDQAIHLCAACA